MRTHSWGGTIIQIALGIAALVGTSGIGLLLLSAIDRGQEKRWRGADPDHVGVVAVAAVQRWAPLELEPYKVKWPSEMSFPIRKLPELYWPSERWNDPYFGPKRNRSAQATSMTDARRENRARPESTDLRAELGVEAGVLPPPPVAKPRPQAVKSKKGSKKASAPQPPAAAHLAQQQQSLESRMASVALAQAKRQQQARPPAPAARPASAPRPASASRPKPAAGNDNLPDVETLALWVDEVGLAGAVSRLRSQTGWDFQKAARYLAQKVSGARR